MKYFHVSNVYPLSKVTQFRFVFFSYVLCFLGVYARDTIPTNLSDHGGIIVNTDPIAKSGSHWVAWDYRYFFDSYGFSPSFYNFPSRTEYNTSFLQSPFSATCGYWAAYFILMRDRGNTLQEITQNFSNTDLEYNDRKVVEIVNRLAPDLKLCLCLPNTQSCVPYCKK